MPTYDYDCEACGHTFEHFQGMSEANLKKCPKCAKNRLVRRIGAGAGLIFKGSGFYQTDYKKASPPASETAAPAAGCGKEACKDTPGTCASDSASSSTPAPSKSEPKSKSVSRSGGKSSAEKGS
jgi:putative FmdB family regulatory protein